MSDILKMNDLVSLRRLVALASFIGLFAGTEVGAAGLVIQDPGLGVFDIADVTYEQLSGITYIGGDQYLAVSDSQPGFYSLTISIDSTQGFISTASVDSFTPFADGSDYEGIAYNPMNASVFASSEDDHSVGEFRVSDGTRLGNVSVPPVFENARVNRSLESLSYGAGGSLWTGNEEALTVDGNASSAGSGTTVRLQEFDNALNPAGQWAYMVDPGQQLVSERKRAYRPGRAPRWTANCPGAGIRIVRISQPHLQSRFRCGDRYLRPRGTCRRGVYARRKITPVGGILPFRQQFRRDRFRPSIG
jgi:uncharacterized protein YjiK